MTPSQSRARGPGRPPANESRTRAADIVAAARIRFADDGIASAALSSIARDAGITLAALYHYFSDRRELFEVVYRESLDLLWADWTRRVDLIEPGSSFGARMAIMLRSKDGSDAEIQLDEQVYDFLNPAQYHIRRHPELHHLFDERDLARRRGFAMVLGDLPAEGRIRGVSTLEEAVGLLEILYSGWGLERMLRRERKPEYLRSTLLIAAALTVDP